MSKKKLHAPTTSELGDFPHAPRLYEYPKRTKKEEFELKKKLGFIPYSAHNILQEKCTYMMILGERSNGKTYDVCRYILNKYAETGYTFAYVRRMDMDIKKEEMDKVWSGLVAEGEVEKATKGKWTDVVKKGRRWYLAKYDENLDKMIVDTNPFGYIFSISSWEHSKGGSVPDVYTILFDEIITRDYYLPDEFVKFQNLVSTIVRNREGVEIFMLGNTVSRSCPYFREMGLTYIKDQQEGEIKVYTYGDSRLRVAVEIAGSVKSQGGKPSDYYFAFDNPQLKMITDGGWEIAVYPHTPIKFSKDDVQFQYFIQYEGWTLHCEIVVVGDMCFTNVHPKTTPIQDENKDLIFSQELSPKPNWRRRITEPRTSFERSLLNFYETEQVYYSDNETGEIMREYLQWCKQS